MRRRARRLLRGSPTAQLLVAIVAVFAVQSIAGLAGVDTGWFALAPPLAVHPWTLVTAVYAHAGVGHLVANAVALAVLGFSIERFTTRARFHLFVLATGMVSGVVQVLASDLVGTPTAVLGISGAVLALLGYLVAGNPATGALLDRLNPRPAVRAVVLLGIAAVVTLATGSPGTALIAHFTGFVLGALAGRAGLLRPGEET